MTSPLIDAAALAGPQAGSWQRDALVIGLVGLAHATSHFSRLLLAVAATLAVGRRTGEQAART
jgi:hypothetical protein